MYIKKHLLIKLSIYLIIATIILTNTNVGEVTVAARINETKLSDSLTDDYTYLIDNPGDIGNPGDEYIENPAESPARTFSSLPKAYGNVSKAVYNQGASPTCWAFAGTSLFEYLVDKKNSITNTSFSVEHLVEKTSIVGNCGFTETSKQGGYPSMFTAYFVAGYGPVSSKNYLWGDAHNLIPGYDFGNAEYRATNIRYIADDRNGDGTLDSNTNSIIKESVYNNGAVYCSIYSDGHVTSAGSNYLGSDNTSYYVYDKTPSFTNHGVLIVGWDDNWSKNKFKTKPKADGAWLVRNSWGANVGNNGYYWVSYEDLTINPKVTICDYEKMDDLQKVYNLDESGRSSDIGSSVKQQGFINVFDIESNEKIKEITFFESSTTATCQIFYVPINSDGTPNVSGKIAVSDEEHIPYSGYHTISVNQNLELTSGTKCGIMVYIKDDKGTGIGFECTTSKTKATVNKGESFFYSSSGTLNDIANYNNSGWGNFSIKLITEKTGTAISDCTISDIPIQAYTGTDVTPKPIVTHNAMELIEGTDYILSYENNIDIGTATIIIKGKGNYIGTKLIDFIITNDVEYATLDNMTDQVFTGSKIRPTPIVLMGSKRLVAGVDYVTTVYPHDYTPVGEYDLIIAGIGKYAGVKMVPYNIVPASISSCYVFGNGEIYTGFEIEHKPVITYNDYTLVEGEDYEISYMNNINIGKGIMKITGVNNFTGTYYVSFNIYAANISNATVSNISSQIYTGSEITPKPTVKFNNIILKEGTDYNLSYSNNIKTGIATIIITGIGNFNGTVNKTFTIISRK